MTWYRLAGIPDGTAGGSRIIGMRRDDSIWTLVVTAIAVTINPVRKSIGLSSSGCLSKPGDFYPGPQIVFGSLMAGHIRSSNSRRCYQAYKRIIKNAPRNPVSKTAAATKRLKASSSSPIKYKPLEVDPWICGNAL